MSSAQGRTKVRRRVLACARCRKRKLSCDGKVPSCTRCNEAAVPCVGFDSSTQREAPRSIADFLEAHIQRLDGRPASAFPSPAASHDAHQDPHAGDKSTYADAIVNAVMEGITPSFLGVSKARPLLNCVVKGTQLPSKKGPVGATDLDENHPRSIINPQPTTAGLDGFDHRTAHGLFHNYLDHVITQYSIYHRSEVISAFNSVYYPASNPGQDTPRNRYIVNILMAISLSTAARKNQAAANALAYSLVRNAMQWIPEVATNDINGLQAMLLLTQYIFLNPTMADVWLLTGLISQAVIDLGLHQELPVDARVTAYQRDMRRRLFWVAWEMEVAVCSIFSRRITLPTRHYDVAFPVEVDDMAITEAGIDFTGRMSKFTSRRIWLFRQIEAEVMSVLYQLDPLPKDSPSLDNWMRQIVESIYAWHKEIQQSAADNREPSFVSRWTEMSLYADIALPYILFILYRPSKKIPHPSSESWITAFFNAVKIADGYWKQANAEFGNIKYVFHPCHHVFNCAIVFLQALTRCKTEILEKFTFEEIEMWMQTFSTFFSTIAERWPDAIRCLREYERLLEPIKKEYDDSNALKNSKLPQQTIPVGDLTAGLYPPYAPAVELDEAFNSWVAFNPTLTADTVDQFGSLSYPMPQDWNSEFNFNFNSNFAMDSIPEA